MAKSRCGTCGEWFEDDELDEHLGTHLEEPGPPVGEQVPLRCPDCKIDTEVYYGVPFKIGQSDPAARLLLGWVSQLGEEPMLIDLYICPQCGRLQQFVNKKTRDRLGQRRK
jgi:DNA-directed RNA polymerase subunit RPC12/RpoP